MAHVNGSGTRKRPEILAPHLGRSISPTKTSWKNVPGTNGSATADEPAQASGRDSSIDGKILERLASIDSNTATICRIMVFWLLFVLVIALLIAAHFANR